MKDLALQSVVYKEGKYYVAQCLDIDISSFGNTEKQALDNLIEELELYLEEEVSGTNVARISVKNPTIHTLHLKYA